MNLPQIKSSGLILYEGPSKFDNKPIVAIATLKSENVKTGNMIQVWILRKNIHPLNAIKNNGDESICGNCVHRGNHNGIGRSCYVNVGQAPSNIWNKYRSGGYEYWDKKSDFIKNRYVRLGAYGDPAALPYGICSFIARYSSGWSGYTHSWRSCDQRFSKLLMASVESIEEATLSQLMNWRTFRVKSVEGGIVKNEFVCPASEEGGITMQCIDCLACSGTRFERIKNGNVTITVHGSKAKLSNYHRAFSQG